VAKENIVALIVGILLAVAVAILATSNRWDRDRSFYPVVTLVVASYYALYGVIGGTVGPLLLELGVALVFVVTAIVGFKKSPWIVMAALAGHGIFDIFHDMLIRNPGMPIWWPDFCMAFDVTLGAYFAWQLKTRRILG
jgi:hypothetical protein